MHVVINNFQLGRGGGARHSLAPLPVGPHSLYETGPLPVRSQSLLGLALMMSVPYLVAKRAEPTSRPAAWARYCLAHSQQYPLSRRDGCVRNQTISTRL
jgi:hypothetical protein